MFRLSSIRRVSARPPGPSTRLPSRKSSQCPGILAASRLSPGRQLADVIVLLRLSSSWALCIIRTCICSTCIRRTPKSKIFGAWFTSGRILWERRPWMKIQPAQPSWTWACEKSDWTKGWPMRICSAHPNICAPVVLWPINDNAWATGGEPSGWPALISIEGSISFSGVQWQNKTFKRNRKLPRWINGFQQLATDLVIWSLWGDYPRQQGR